MLYFNYTLNWKWRKINNLLLQWGSAVTNNGFSIHTYPITFNVVYNIQTSPRGTGNQDGSIYWTTTNETISGFRVMIVGNNSISIGQYHNYVAIGY